jgi:hypothetical protein
MDFQLILAAFATVTIIALAFYAGILINRIKRQKVQIAKVNAEKEQQASVNKQTRNDNICESIRFIARATAQKQCNVSESAIRLSVLLETLLVDPKIDIDKQYPAISGLFEKVKDFATHAERKKIDKKTLKQQDKQRQIFENEFEDSIIKEAQSLENFSI